MSPAHSIPPSRRPVLPAFCNGGRPPRQTLVTLTSLRGLHRLLVLSLLLQLCCFALLLSRSGGLPLLRPGGKAPVKTIRLGDGPLGLSRQEAAAAQLFSKSPRTRQPSAQQLQRVGP